MHWISGDYMGAIYLTVYILLSLSFSKTDAAHRPLFIILIFLGLCRDTPFSGWTIKNCVHPALKYTANIKFESREIIIICTYYLFEGTKMYSTPVEIRIAISFAYGTQTLRTRTWGRRSNWKNRGRLTKMETCFYLRLTRRYFTLVHFGVYRKPRGCSF